MGGLEATISELEIRVVTVAQAALAEFDSVLFPLSFSTRSARNPKESRNSSDLAGREEIN